MSTDCPDVLLVIPAYREHLRLPPFLDQLIERLKSSSYSVSILIVDNGSSSLERKKLSQLVNRGTFGSCSILEPIVLDKKAGKGGGILKGWRAGIKPRLYAYVDADGAVPANEVARLLDVSFQRGPDKSCLFAARIKMLGHVNNRNLTRHVSGRIFANTVNLILHCGAYDIQCGFKIIPSAVFNQIDPMLGGSGLCFDIELMLALQHHNVPIQEVPIDWEEKAGGHISIYRDSWGMILQLIRLAFLFERWKKTKVSREH